MKKNKKTVDDQGSTDLGSCDTPVSPLPDNQARCHFCGVRGMIVARFPHRGYGRNRFCGLKGDEP